jgi:hypothetical protein
MKDHSTANMDGKELKIYRETLLVKKIFNLPKQMKRSWVELICVVILISMCYNFNLFVL